MLTPIAMETKD